jgi:hypothetical protein
MDLTIEQQLEDSVTFWTDKLETSVELTREVDLRLVEFYADDGREKDLSYLDKKETQSLVNKLRDAAYFSLDVAHELMGET